MAMWRMLVGAIAVGTLVLPLTAVANETPPASPSALTGPSSRADSDAPPRLSGPDRMATAAAIADRAFPGTAPVVYLARSDVFADALAAGILTDGPVLLVPSCATVPDVVLTAVDRLDPDSVIALGGPAAVCDEVLDAVAGARSKDRLAGPDRYATAIAIARRQFPGVIDEVFLASGANAPDAVAGGSLTSGPILLVPPTGVVPDVVTEAVADFAPQRFIVLGGTAAITDDVVSQVAGATLTQRVAGETRYETAVQISAFQFGTEPDRGAGAVYLARGDVFADAVAAGSLRDGPVLLVPSCGPLPDAVRDELARLRPGRIFGLGGSGAICDELLLAAAAVGLDPDVIIPDTTVVLDEIARQALVSADPDGTLVFASDGAPRVIPGDVIVSYEIAEHAPQGLLRRVTAVERAGDNVVIGTETAALTDAIHAGSLTLEEPLTSDNVVSSSGPVARSAASAPRASEDVHLVSFDNTEVFDLGNGVTVTGTLAYDAVLHVDVDIDYVPFPRVEEFSVVLEANQSSQLELRAEHESSWAGGPRELFEAEFRCFWTAIGLVPVALCPEIEVSVSAEGDVKGTFVVGAQQEVHLEGGGSYKDRSWTPIRTFEHSEQITPPKLDIEGHARAELRAELALEVYDLAGPYVYGAVNVRGEVLVDDTDVCWGIYAGINGGIGGELDEDLFGEDLRLPEYSLLSEEFLIAEDPVPHVPCGDQKIPGWVGTMDITRDETFYNSDDRSSWIHDRHAAEYTNIRLVQPDYGAIGTGAGRYDADITGNGRHEEFGPCEPGGPTTKYFEYDWQYAGQPDRELPVRLQISEADELQIYLDYLYIVATGSNHCVESQEEVTSYSASFCSMYMVPPDDSLQDLDTDPNPNRLAGSVTYTHNNPPMTGCVADGRLTYDVTFNFDLQLDTDGDGVAG